MLKLFYDNENVYEFHSSLIMLASLSRVIVQHSSTCITWIESPSPSDERARVKVAWCGVIVASIPITVDEAERDVLAQVEGFALRL